MKTQAGPFLLTALALALALPFAEGAAEHPSERSYVVRARSCRWPGRTERCGAHRQHPLPRRAPGD